MTRQECLDAAARCVNGQRDKEYGTPEDSFRDIAAIWSVILRQPITPAQVALMMAGLKVARLAANPRHADSIVDLAGYAACLAEVSSPAGG